MCTFFCYNGTLPACSKIPFSPAHSEPQSAAHGDHNGTDTRAFVQMLSIRERSSPLLPLASPLFMSSSDEGRWSWPWELFTHDDIDDGAGIFFTNVDDPHYFEMNSALRLNHEKRKLYRLTGSLNAQISVPSAHTRMLKVHYSTVFASHTRRRTSMVNTRQALRDEDAEEASGRRVIGGESGSVPGRVRLARVPCW